MATTRGAPAQPRQAWRWELTGAGLESFGRGGRPSLYDVAPPGPGELLARVDACGICYSDIKILNLGGEHPRLRGRDLARDPVVMGHEVSLTVIAVGPGADAPFQPGDRAIVQADIYYQGEGMAMGYRLPGGFSQYVRIGREILEGDEGCYLLPVPSHLGYSEAALCEPWACVEASYRYQPRRSLRAEGALLVVAIGERIPRFIWPAGRARPRSVLLVGEPEALPELASFPDGWPPPAVITRWQSDAVLAYVRDEGTRFDDLILLGEPSAADVEVLMPLLARGGIMNLMNCTPPERVRVDVGRVHYEEIGIVGTTDLDPGSAYAESRSGELKAGGAAWFIGAGGPMGQMHLQRAIGLPRPPSKIVVTQNTGPRFDDLRERFGVSARERGIELVLLDPKRMSREMTEEAFFASLREAGAGEPRLGASDSERQRRGPGPGRLGRGADSGGGRAPGGGSGFDDIVCLVPSLPTIERAGDLLAPGGGVNLFAGVPVGTTARLDLGPIVTRGARYWGTSGSTIADLRYTANKLAAGELATDGVVAAVAGIRGVRDGLAAVREGRFLGKTVIYPQLDGLPLLSIADVAARYPTVAERLTRGKYWNRDAETELIRLAGGGS